MIQERALKVRKDQAHDAKGKQSKKSRDKTVPLYSHPQSDCAIIAELHAAVVALELALGD